MKASFSSGNDTVMPASLNFLRVRMLFPHSASVTVPSLSLSTRSHCLSASDGPSVDAGEVVVGVSPAFATGFSAAAPSVVAAAAGAVAAESGLDAVGAGAGDGRDR